MTAGFHPLHNNRVCALLLHTFRKLHTRYNGDDLHSCRVQLLKVRDGIACTERYERRLLLADHIHNLILIRRHEHDVDPERTIRQRTAAANLIARVLRCTPSRRDDARTARIRYRRGEIRLRDPCHAALQDGNLNPQEFLQLICHVTTSYLYRQTSLLRCP